MKRLRVNPIACDGFGYCAELAPQLVQQDDWGYPILSAVPITGAALKAAAQKAVATCPRKALQVVDDADAV